MPRETSAPLPQPVFGEPVATRDPTGFTVVPADQELYKGIETLLKKDVVRFPGSRIPDQEVVSLGRAWGAHGAEVIKAAQEAGQIRFHAVGDTGAASTRTFPSEIRVADALTSDLHSSRPQDRPAFLFHLGDVVYNFGEAAYYYDQFYDPFRDYAAPIFAVPGNHDSFIVPNTPSGQEPLSIFMRNFCASSPVVTPEAGSLHRTAMTQPGVYFSLDAPFVRIIGLFSNALEDPGVISSEKGTWVAVPDLQLSFLRAQLRRIRTESYAGAVLIAVHHPPFSYAPEKAAPSGRHAGSPVMLSEIDRICLEESVYPHAVLSGHAHNYQRYTRSLRLGERTISVPFVVCGSGGHNVNPLVSARAGRKAGEPGNGVDVSYMDSSNAVQSEGLVLNAHDQENYGFLTITASPKTLEIEFHPVTPHKAAVDSVTVDLASHAVITAARQRSGGRRSSGPKHN